MSDYEDLVSVGFLAANHYLNQESDDLFDLRHACIAHWLMFQAVHDWAGQMRRQGELATIAGFVSAEAARIEAEFSLLRSQSELWPGLENPEWHDAAGFALLLSFQHIRFERIHPFRDGNGRIGRLLLAASLRQRFRSATLYVDWNSQKQAYVEALRLGCEGDLAPLAGIILHACGLPAFPNPPYWSPYRLGPRMLEQDRCTTLEEDLKWSRVAPAFWKARFGR